MIDSFPLVPASESVETLTGPSIDAVRATFAALERTVDTVGADCRTVAETLSGLNEALGTISQSAGPSQQWGGIGLIGLPIMGAIKAVKGLAGQYVKQQTGMPLATWTDLVASSTDQVETYLARLGTVAEVAQRYSGSAGTRGRRAGRRPRTKRSCAGSAGRPRPGSRSSGGWRRSVGWWTRSSRRTSARSRSRPRWPVR